MLETEEFDIEDKEVYFIQEFYKDESSELEQGIMYLANKKSEEIKATKLNVAKIPNRLYKKCYLNKNHQMIKTERLKKHRMK